MSAGLTAACIFGGLFALLAIGFPVGFSLLLVSVIGIIVWINPASLSIVPSTLFVMTTKDYFIALPTFIFMATVLQHSGIGTALYDMFYKWFAGLRGGLAIATTAVSTVIAAMTGSGSTAPITMGLIAYPEMKKRGYSKDIMVGSIVSGGCLGPLIPPSITMILVAAFGYLSIGKLFIAGIFPGLLTAVLFILYIAFVCWRHPEKGPALPAEQRASWKEKFLALRGSILPVLLILSVLGLIYTGVSTPSEAGGIGAFGALLCAAFYRNLTLKNLKNALYSALRINAMIFWIIIGGSCFSSLLGLTGVNHFIESFTIGLSGNRWVVFIIMMLIIIILGMFMDSTPIVIITMPIFIPIARSLGFDPLWFGLVVTMGLLIGFITPPFGLAMFYFMGVGIEEVKMTDVYRACLPYVFIMIVSWILCIAFPVIPMWLPNMMIK